MDAQTILLVDDDPEIREGIRILLTGEGYHIIEAEDGPQAMEKLSGAVDLVILDIMMPGMSGLRVCEEMRKVSTAPILFLTAKAQESDKLMGLTAGGDDYLPKPFAMKELVARVHSLARRNTDYGTGNLTFGDVELNAETYELKAHTSVRLSHVEFELLRTFILNRNRALSADFLLGRVWTDDDEADQATVSLYVRYLCSKLEAIDAHVTIAEIDGGYILEEGDEA